MGYIDIEWSEFSDDERCSFPSYKPFANGKPPLVTGLIFGVDVQKVAADVVRYRQKNDA
jgi:hypothetical protein